jgi:hypothetical protein
MAGYYPAGSPIRNQPQSNLFYTKQGLFGVEYHIRWKEFFRLLPGTLKSIILDPEYRKGIVEAFKK